MTKIIIKCVECQAGYKIDESKIPNTTVRIKCKKCGKYITISQRPPVKYSGLKNGGLKSPMENKALTQDDTIGEKSTHSKQQGKHDVEEISSKNRKSFDNADSADDKRKKSRFAITSLVCGILSIPTFGLLSIPAVILGHIASIKIKKNELLEGKRLAVTGYILGYIGILIFIFFAYQTYNKPGFIIKKLPSGQTVKFQSIGKIYFSNGDPGLQLEYETDLNIAETNNLRKEAEAIWKVFKYSHRI